MSNTKKQLISALITALLCAISVVFSRFLSFNIWNLSIGFAFLPILICAMLLGPVWGGICGGLADFIGAMLFPFGSYFPGFTVTAFLSGMIFGFIPKQKQSPLKFILIAALFFIIEEIICSLTLNSLWITLLYGGSYIPVVVSRIPVSVVTIVIKPIAAFLIARFALNPMKKALEF